MSRLLNMAPPPLTFMDGQGRTYHAVRAQAEREFRQAVELKRIRELRKARESAQRGREVKRAIAEIDEGLQRFESPERKRARQRISQAMKPKPLAEDAFEVTLAMARAKRDRLLAEIEAMTPGRIYRG